MPYKIFNCVLILLLFTFSACNKDKVIEEEIAQKPIITLDSETGVYSVKIGKEITISPTVEYADNAIYSWLIDGKIVETESSFTTSFPKKGEVFITFRVETLAGATEEELRVDVSELAPPVISLALPSRGLKVLPETDYIFTPDIQNQNEDNFKCKWIRDGKVVSKDIKYTFNEKKLGTYPITIEASNIDGKTTKEIIVEVVETMPYKVYFEKPSYFQITTDRNTFVDRPVYLAPILEYFDNPQYTWKVNGEIAEAETNSVFKFTPTKAGDFTINVEVVEKLKTSTSITRNVSCSATTVSAEVIVHCYGNKQEDNYREATASSNIYQNKVYEYTPAPGQFIGELNTARFTGSENTQEDAIAYATKRLNAKSYVSLGGFGGYIIVGFDHSIANTSNEYDFAIQGNAFDGSSEPGIVWVMQDINKNGQPDDEWYELQGSETGKDGTIQDYSITYYRPAGIGMDVKWSDSEGKSGTIDYLKQFHAQDYYYPQWIKEDSYTLRGTLLSSKNKQDPSTGYWKNQSYDRGYVDNFGNDQIEGGSTLTGSGQRNGFEISNAIYKDGTPIDLKYIDFIKVQVGVNAKSGALGEISTEVFSFIDL